MTALNLVLFGKHPAWSDHMFISDDTDVSNYLKRVFYDHSIIPGLQGGEGDKRVSETWGFLIFIEDQVFFIANAISRDSVGRRRFPLIAAYPLPEGLKLEGARDALKELKAELLSLLSEMLESPGEDLNQWQEIVTKKAKSFRSKVDWSKVDASDVKCQLKRDEVMGLISRLVDEYDSFDLKSCPIVEACSFVQLGLKQFQSAPPAMLVLDHEENGTGLLFAVKDAVGFDLKRYLYGNLTSINVSADDVPQKVVRMLESAGLGDQDSISVDQVPSIKIGASESLISRKFLIPAIISIIIISILFGLFSGGSKDQQAFDDSSEIDSTQQGSPQQKWNSNAIAYIKWIQPLTEFVHEQSLPISGFRLVSKELESDLDPFAAVGAEEVSVKLAKKPPEHFFTSENTAKLELVYANISQLKKSLEIYYKKQFSSDLLKELKRQNYPVPSFIDIDFSQQPIVPDFGSGLIEQLKAHISSRNVLREIVLETKILWNSIIKPLHEVYPKHAKLIQRCVQNMITTSESAKQFREQYAVLLEEFGYPEFIEIDEIQLDKLSENSAWQGVLEKEVSLESIHELVKLLKVNHKDHLQSQAAATVKQAAEEQIIEKVVEEPVVEEPVVEEPIAEEPVVEELVAEEPSVVEQVIEEQAIGQVLEEPAVLPEMQTLVKSVDLDLWDFFLETSLGQLQDNRLTDVVKGHEKAIRAQILKKDTVEEAQMFSEFKDKINRLIVALKPLDSPSIPENSEGHLTYPESEKLQQHLSDYLFNKYTAANVEAGDVESVRRVSQEISLSVDDLLAELSQSFAELEASYFEGQKDEKSAELKERIVTIIQNPLYLEGMFGSRLDIIRADISDNTIAIGKSGDFIWYLKNLMAKGQVDQVQLTRLTQAYNALNSKEQTSELKNMLFAAFEKNAQELGTKNSKKLLELYQNLATYLPQQLHTQQQKEFSEIALFCDRYSQDQSAETLSKAELERLRDSTKSPLTKKFYTGLLAQSDEKNSSSSETFLDQIEKVSGVTSVSISDDSSRIEVLFEGRAGRLVFLPLETQNGLVFVQQSPLALLQYTQLSNICNFDTEYYLTLQDSFWPRSFEVGMGAGFSPLSKWQFRNKKVFTPIKAFSKTDVPAHLNEPKEVLRMAKFFGFRLLKPEECSDFIRQSDLSLAVPLGLTGFDKEDKAQSEMINDSVYAELIKKLIAEGKWTGGFDFERGTPGADQFSDVIGGSAELAYDGSDFYVSGGSWLYEPAVLEEPVRVAEPDRMYMDIGIRFAIDAPTQSAAKKIQEWALQLLTGNE